MDDHRKSVDTIAMEWLIWWPLLSRGYPLTERSRELVRARERGGSLVDPSDVVCNNSCKGIVTHRSGAYRIRVVSARLSWQKTDSHIVAGGGMPALCGAIVASRYHEQGAGTGDRGICFEEGLGCSLDLCPRPRPVRGCGGD